jgi:hypothetical protein
MLYCWLYWQPWGKRVNQFAYADSAYPIRADLGDAYREYWKRLAAPGCWWNGAERVAIAQEVRNASQCQFCAARKQALSAYTGDNNHQHDGKLPLAAVDAIHRIVTDQARITQTYIDSLADDGISEEQYVELASIVVVVFSIDEFNRALGLSPEPLPQPVAGQPSHYRPALAKRGTGFVSMLPVDGAVGQEADLWVNGQTANVLRALTLVPDGLRDWKLVASAQYLSVQGMGNFVGQEGRHINRMQMELIAARVSAVNECFY